MYYSNFDYWESRYARDTAVFEWYQTYADLRGIIMRFVKIRDKVLISGNGTSELGEHMVTEGFVDVTCVDFCTAAVAAMEMRKRKLGSTLAASGGQLNYVVADLAALDRFSSNTFNVIIDKATLDSCLCGSDEAAQYAHCMRVLREASRVLKSNGKLLVLSHASKESRRIFENQDLGFKIEVHALPKPEGFLDEDALPLMEDSIRNHFFYVLTKQN